MTYIWEDSTWVKNAIGRPSILLWGRNAEKKEEVKLFVVKGFEPYFYVPFEAEAKPEGIRRVEGTKVIDALGREVRKVFTTLPSDVPKARGYYEWTDEADILFDIRYAIDRGLVYAFNDGGDSDPIPCEIDKPLLPRICYLDIEVRSPIEVIPTPANPNYPIVSIQVGDSYAEQSVLFTSGVPQLRSNQVACKDERDLYSRFMDWIQKVNPDVITGWYSNGFDLPYIVQRAGVLGIKLNRLTRLPDGYNKPRAEQRGYEWFIRVTGRQCVDMLDAFKKMQKAEGELESYDLKSISSKFGGFSYNDMGAFIDELFKGERWGEFLDYIENDVKALRLIDKNLKLFEFYEGLRQVTGVKLEDTLKNSKMIESLLFHAKIKPMPTRKHGNTSDSFIGALVLSPSIGLHSDVAVFDLTALYPTIILAFNISPDIDKTIPKVIGKIIHERDKLRTLRMQGQADEVVKKKEVVLKFITTSFYGVLGWPGFRLYRPELAEFITTTGRGINQFLQRAVSSRGHMAIYGDTDSIFVSGIANEPTGRAMQGFLNEQLQSWAKEKGASFAPTLKLEKIYRKILFKRATGSQDAAKKRYAGHLIWKDGQSLSKMDFTGIELKRSDQSVATRRALRAFLDCVLLRDDTASAIAEVRRIANDVRNGRINPYDVSIPRGVKDPINGRDPWSRGVRSAERIFGTSFPLGVKPRLLYTVGGVEEICIHDGITREQLEERVRVDWAVMYRKTIEGKMKSFVESLGFSWEGVMHGQTSLESF